jgi:hypothetical protein
MAVNGLFIGLRIWFYKMLRLQSQESQQLSDGMILAGVSSGGEVPGRPIAQCTCYLNLNNHANTSSSTRGSPLRSPIFQLGNVDL